MQRRKIASIALGVLLLGLVVTGIVVLSEAQNQNNTTGSDDDELCEIDGHDTDGPNTIDDPDNRT